MQDITGKNGVINISTSEKLYDFLEGDYWLKEGVVNYEL